MPQYAADIGEVKRRRAASEASLAALRRVLPAWGTRVPRASSNLMYDEADCAGQRRAFSVVGLHNADCLPVLHRAVAFSPTFPELNAELRTFQCQECGKPN